MLNSKVLHSVGQFLMFKIYYPVERFFLAPKSVLAGAIVGLVLCTRITISTALISTTSWLSSLKISSVVWRMVIRFKKKKIWTPCKN